MSVFPFLTDIKIDFARNIAVDHGSGSDGAVIQKSYNGFFLWVRTGDAVLIGHASQPREMPGLAGVTSRCDSRPSASLVYQYIILQNASFFAGQVNTFGSSQSVEIKRAFLCQVTRAEALPSYRSL